ncbi:soluble quino protein glucose dehydrogenase [Pluteus cervinus]|uniref:Soluble quino protein glucose dehydrogenase n=1 Tax=Pluteus cervinus TaxID=181527 RepID=A0ACD3A6T6_9AGAR|nr:soluble quino protein glucose dehydrogenase [Pluteus cervinus]
MMLPLLLLGFAAHFHGVFSQCQPLSSLNFTDTPNITPGVTAQVVFNNLTHPRGIKFDDASNLLVVDSGVGVIALTLNNTAGCQGWQRSVVVQNSTFNHGIDIGNGTLYVSTSTSVVGFQYDSSTISVGSGTPTVIVTNIAGAGSSGRRFLLIPASGSDPAFLIVTAGTDSDTDFAAAQASSGLSQIRRFALNASLPGGGYDWMTDGEMIAFGLRNAVGLTMDSNNNLWITENSSDNVTWDGIDVSANNPADEFNVVSLNNITGGFYGYPDCDTVWDPTSFSSFTTGEQFSDTSSFADTFCQSPSNNIPPMLSFQAHASPLDIKFYTGVTGNNTSSALNSSWVGNSFVSFHGSAETPEVGFGVVMIPWNTAANTPTANADTQTGYSFLVQATNLTACPGQCIRPVGLQFDTEGRLFVSSDATGEVCRRSRISDFVGFIDDVDRFS